MRTGGTVSRDAFDELHSGPEAPEDPMSKKGLLSLVSLLVGFNAGFCQVANQPPVPTPAPTPATEAAQAPATPGFSAANWLCCGFAGNNLPGVFTAEAGYLLAFLANSNNAILLGSTDTLAHTGVSILSRLGDAEHG